MRVLLIHLLRRCRRGATLFVVAAFCLLLAGACGRAIGDDCTTDSQCPTGAYCDKTMPSGMCVKGPCRVGLGDCPEESVCVEFKNGETYCMASCDDDGDCRDGYVCVTTVGLYPFCSVVDSP